MSIASELLRIYDDKKAIREAIMDGGVDVPEGEGMVEYYKYIDQLGGGSSWDPNNPTLESFKQAVDNGEDIEIGLEIPDTYDGKDNPLIVAQKLDSSNNSSYGGVEGYILIRKYVDPISQQWNTSTIVSYPTSAVKTYLDSDYLNGCSDILKGMIGDIAVIAAGAKVSSKWFLPSGLEIGSTFNAGEGIFWDYFQNQTGLSSASNLANNGRVVNDNNGTVRNWWLRSASSAGGVCYATTDGRVSRADTTNKYGILPTCFIAKSSNGGGSDDTIFDPDLSGPLDDKQLENLKEIVKSGKASEYLDLGDELLVNYGSYVMPFEVVGFKDVEVEGGEKKHAINLLSKYTSEVGSAWRYGVGSEYSSCALRTSGISTYQGKLDSAFVNCLANTKVETYNRNGTIDVVYDKLFAPSMPQLGVTDMPYTNTSQNNIEGPAFAAYKNSTDATRIKYAINTISAEPFPQPYWTRTVSFVGNYYSDCILSSGKPEYAGDDFEYRVVVACNFIGD